jgi:hypothetical protein
MQIYIKNKIMTNVLKIWNLCAKLVLMQSGVQMKQYVVVINKLVKVMNN